MKYVVAFSRLTTFVVLTTTLVAFAFPADARAAQRPNVILILIDDQGYGDFSCHGNPVLKTPNMEALAAQGVRLDDFHVSPWCSPTRAALLTGRHCRSVGVQGTNRTEQHLATEAVTMAEIFAANGYATGIFGKWHLGDRYPLRPMDRGFAESVVFPDGAVTTIPDFWGNDYYDDTYLHNGAPQQFKGYCTDVWFDLAAKFIETNQDRPFFCYLATNSAHFPYIVPERYTTPYRQMRDVRQPDFLGMIANLDEHLGRFRQRLAELDLEKNTMLIFLGDNGTAAGDFNAGMRGKKTSPYDGGHRVGCFVYYPDGGVMGGRVVDQLAAHIDILPTLVDIAGLEIRPRSPKFDGISLKASLTGQGNVDDARILIESFSRGVMTPQWRLVNNAELYDIRKDPGQKHDVAAQFPGVVARLRKALREYETSEDKRPHAIVVGSKQQNPVTLTGEDWAASTLIFQHAIGVTLPKHDGAAKWKVEVAQAGRYRLSLRRWPSETATPITAALPRDKWCYGMTRSERLDAVETRLRAGDAEVTMQVTDAMLAAEFTLDLAVGHTTLEGWFVDSEQQRWTAPYLEVERLEGDEP